MKMTRFERLLSFAFPMAVEHTTTEIEGVRRTKGAKLIVATHSQAQQLNHIIPNKVMSIETALNILPGSQKAVVIDHYALIILVGEHTKAYRNEMESLL